MKIEDIVLVIGGMLTALCAGLLYGFSVAIVPALRALKGREHVAAMQLINVKILNPIFFLSFLGPVLLLPLAAFLNRNGSQFGLLVAAAILHIAGVVGVTAAKNVPLNDKLARHEVGSISDAEADQIREAYQKPGSPWMRWHNARMLAGIAATVLVFIACLSKSTPE